MVVKETFRFPKILSIIFFILFIFFIIYAFYNIEDKTFLLFLAIFFIIGLFLSLTKFNLHIDNKGIKYSLYPFTKKSIEWKEIKDYKINKISALGDFAGWGIRYSKKYGWGYIFDSYYGITITQSNGKR